MLVGEKLAALLFGEKKVTDVLCAITHRHALEGPERQQVRGETQRSHVILHVRQSQRAGQVSRLRLALMRRLAEFRV